MVAVLSDDAREALALPRLLVARAADGEVGVAAAPLAAVGAEVPEAGHAPVALLPDHAGLAPALARLEVALESKIVRDRLRECHTRYCDFMSAGKVTVKTKHILLKSMTS